MNPYAWNNMEFHYNLETIIIVSKIVQHMGHKSYDISYVVDFLSNFCLTNFF